MQGGRRCDIVSDKNQLGLDDFFGTAADAVHPAHPFQLVILFQCFSYALCILHLTDDEGKLFVCLFVQTGKVAGQLTGQEQLVVPDGSFRYFLCKRPHRQVGCSAEAATVRFGR